MVRPHPWCAMLGALLAASGCQKATSEADAGPEPSASAKVEEGPPVRVGPLILQDTGRHKTGTISGRVIRFENASNRAVRAVQVRLTYQDAAGNQLGYQFRSTVTFGTPLAPGASTETAAGEDKFKEPPGTARVTPGIGKVEFANGEIWSSDAAAD